MLGVLTITTVAACAQGSSSSQWRTFRADGVSIRYPPGWDATRRPLTPVTYPQQVVAIASYPLPRDNSGADGCEPKEALDRMPATGAFIYGWEYANARIAGVRVRDFSRRPKRFSLTGFGQYECFGPSYGLYFRDADRLFQIHVTFGRRASLATRRTALRVLDSFHAEARGRS